MEIILLKDIEKLGRRGELAIVRPGYGRNYLLPRGLALPATPQNRALMEREKKRAADRSSRERLEAEKLAEELGKLRLRLEAPAGEKEKLFGAITSQDLAEAIAREGISLDKRQIQAAEPIRSLGTHSVTVEVGAGIKAAVTVEVVKKETKKS